MTTAPRIANRYIYRIVSAVVPGMLTKVAPLLRADHLTRDVNGKAIVHEVSFEVQEGELLAIVGPSGSGKSSLLRLLNRLDEPTGGTLFIKGEDYRNIGPRHL